MVKSGFGVQRQAGTQEVMDTAGELDDEVESAHEFAWLIQVRIRVHSAAARLIIQDPTSQARESEIVAKVGAGPGDDVAGTGNDRHVVDLQPNLGAASE